MTFGFTLVEMLVTIAILFAVITVILFNAPALNQSLFLNQAARGLAFRLRDAQSRAVAINVLQVSGLAPTNYGIHVTTSSSDGDRDGIPDNRQFVLFTDRNGDNIYNPFDDTLQNCNPTVNECVQKFNFAQGIIIQSITRPTGAGDTPVNPLSIAFERPDPTVKIASVAGPPYASIGPFKIRVCSSGCKTIQVWLTGQISIQP